MISIENVDLVYSSRHAQLHALDGISFCASEGEFICIVGPSGCGKSTLLKIVAGLMNPSSGAVRVNGKLLPDMNCSVGIVFQSPLLMPWRTVLQNVMLQIEIRGLPAARYRERARVLLRLVGLSGFENSYSHELSGGMQQRVALCRALIHEPSILLMDEPFGALDAITREEMNHELQSLWIDQPKTVLFITHSISEAIYLADRILVMSARPGRMLADIRIDFARPRSLDSLIGSSAFAEHNRTIRAYLNSKGAALEGARAL
jgi:NitT/TauT family transport system ATP-binding protein